MSCSMLFPMQSRPLFCGGLQTRDRVRTPLSQERVQIVHGLHESHLPSTVDQKKKPECKKKRFLHSRVYLEIIKSSLH